jgi:hypothetical protein
MSTELNIENAGHGASPKKGVYKELRQNPYLLGLSTVSPKASNILNFLLITSSSRHLEAFCLATTRVLFQASLLWSHSQQHSQELRLTAASKGGSCPLCYSWRGLDRL